MFTLTDALLIAVLALLGVLIFLALKRGRIEPKDTKSAVSSVWKDSGVQEQIGRLSVYADDILKDYSALDQMLRVPEEWGRLARSPCRAS
jgi:hypothetical protein